MIRERWHILVEGDDVPPPLDRFEDLKLPAWLQNTLAQKGITQPSPIQIQVCTGHSCRPRERS